ncbi:MAG TPA: gliding motility-associated C-terminal domain-containing protein [Cytophagaceae bacterium]|nr:gliding motility-associated C-terminal domain-containing protein [Cytophagaceae bacterium]
MERTKKNIPISLCTILIIVLSFLNVQQVRASHAMAVDLTYECLGGNQYEFTLSFYRDCKGISAPTNPEILIQSASCNINSSIFLSLSSPAIEVSSVCPAQINNTTCHGGAIPGVQKYTYKGTYTLPGNCPDWVFSYSECCRNNLITNLSSKDEIYVEATLNNSVVSCNSSPTYTSLPVPYLCSGQPYSYNHGVVDINGDSLVYTLVNPLQGHGNLIGYTAGYSPSYPVITTTGSVQFDQQTGQMDLTPNGIQVCVVTIQVKEYRNGVVIGSTMRDMQLIISNCTTSSPYLVNNGEAQNETGGFLIGKNLVEACPGQQIDFDITGQDDNGNNITLNTNIATAIPGATLAMTTSGNTGSGHFSWMPSLSDIGLHTFTVNIRNDACPISGQQTYSFSIHVLTGTTAGYDRSYCPSGGPVQLTAIGGNMFQWTELGGGPAASLSCTSCFNPKASPSITTTYVVESNFSSACRNKDTITVYVVPDFNLSMSDDTVGICSLKEGATFTAEASGTTGSYTYDWTPSGDLSNASIAKPTARPKVTTTYYATVTSSQGCTQRDSVVVRVKNLIDLYMVPGDSVETCDSVKIGVVEIPEGEIFSETFDHEIDSSNWVSINGGILANTCGSYSDNASYYLNGLGTRSMTTKTLDVSSGGSISFFVKAGFCDNCTCDRPENTEEDENMYLEYTTDGGATWKQLYTMDATLMAPLNAFSDIVVNIPDDAKTTATQFRWRQANHFSNLDVWVLDDIKIHEGLGKYKYQWTPSTDLSSDTVQSPFASPGQTTMYTVHVTDQETGCVYVDSVKVIFKEEFQIIGHQDLVLCPNDTNFRVQVPGPTGSLYTYKWLPPTGLSDPNISNPIVAPTTSTKYTITISDNNTGCLRKAIVDVTVPPLFQVNAGADTSVCFSHSLPVQTTVDIPDTYDYLWRPITGVSDQSLPNPIMNPTTDMQYIVFVKNRTTGCTKSDTINIKVFPDFTLTTTRTATLCPYATTVTISALSSPGTDFTYHWSPAAGMADPTQKEQVVQPVSDSTFYVISHKNNGCYKKDSVTVKLYQPGSNLKVSHDTTIHEGDFALLYATGANRYEWKTGNELVGTQNIISVSPLKQTVYKVYGYDDCYPDSATITVEVIPLEFYIPNLITPNGDGMNDNFKITNFGTRWDLEVYNRWGQLIYQKEKYINEWSGAGQSDGVYYYHIKDTKTNERYKGWVEVLR